MKFPKKTIFNSRHALHMFALTLLVAIMSVAVSAQKTFSGTSKTELAAAASLEQCRNGGDITTPAPCDASGGGNTGWVTGNTGASNAHWAERDFLPYRMLFTGLPGDNNTVHAVTIGYDILKSGVHAIDYLGTYNWTETAAMGNNPCDGVAGIHCNTFDPSGTDTITIPNDPVIATFPLPQPTMPANGEFTMWGGTLLTIDYEPYAGGEERRVTLTFKSTVPNPVLAWAGHVAWRGEWGLGNSAGGITGSPYHMRLIDLDGSGGNQDRSLSADAVAVPARVTIVKRTEIETVLTPIDLDWHFLATVSGFVNPANTIFTLNTSTGPSQSEVYTTVLLGVDNAIDVTETNSVQGGWSLSDMACVEIEDPQFPGGSIPDSGPILGDPDTIRIIAQEGEIITCTFTNAFTQPTAAPASISGRVATADGTGISNARMTLMNASTGETFYALTNPFGYYTFEGMSVADFYILSVGHKRYSFSDDQRAFTLETDLQGVDFIAN